MAKEGKVKVQLVDHEDNSEGIFLAEPRRVGQAHLVCFNGVDYTFRGFGCEDDGEVIVKFQRVPMEGKIVLTELDAVK